MDNEFDPELVELIRSKADEIVPVDRVVELDEELPDLGFHSLYTMRLIVELETALSIEFDNYDLLLENYSTIGKICRMVMRTRETIGAPDRCSACLRRL